MSSTAVTKFLRDLLIRGFRTYRIENWYDSVKHLTFATSVIRLEYEEAKMLQKFRDQQRAYFQAHGKTFVHDFAHYTAMMEELLRRLSPEHQKLLAALRERLQKPIDDYVKSSGGAFVKLSSRSPKDAAMISDKVTHLIEERIRDSKCNNITVGDQAECEAAQVETLIAFTRAMSCALKVTSGDEALSLLMQSQRIYTDLILFTLNASSPAEFDMQLIIREWNSEVCAEWEFRAFVFSNQLTVCTQYYGTCFVPEMKERRAEIATKIRDYWERNLRDVPKLREIGTYVFDLALTPNLEKIFLIEINNPPPICGTSLWDWDKPDEQKVMQSGPWTLRVLEAMPANAYWELHPPLRVEICRMRGLLKTLEQAKAEAQRAKEDVKEEEAVATKTEEPKQAESSCLVM